MTENSNNSHIDSNMTGSNWSKSEWTTSEKISFRIIFVLLLLMCIPTNPDWYKNLFEYDWLNLHWNVLYYLTGSGRVPEFVRVKTESGRWGLASYVNILITVLLSVVIGLAWTFLVRGKEPKTYNNWYYWVRVLARYQIGFATVIWGFRKLIPMQMIWPPNNILNTPFMNIDEQKLYWQSVGIVPAYESFLGVAEVVAGMLLLFRRTTSLGALFTLIVMGNIVVINHVYDGSVHLHSFSFVLVAAVVLWKDIPDFYRLFLRRQDTIPQPYYPDFKLGWQKGLHLGIKSLLIGIFVVLSFFLHLFSNHKYRVPEQPGLAGASGYYNVTEFRLNNNVIPYSPFDTIRWQDAVFEDWATLAFAVNRSEQIDLTNGAAFSPKGGVVDDIDRGWESAGVQGRHFFYYEADTVNQTLYLQNKNKSHREEKQILHYDRPSENRIILSGINEFHDSVYIVLDKVDKSYPVIENRY